MSRAAEVTSTAAGPAVWSGRWVADRLGVQLVPESGVGGLAVGDLVGMALRINPRRAHLLVSRALGKHLPTDPVLVYGAGRLLGALVADTLAGGQGTVPDDGGPLLAAALAGADRLASARLLACCDRHRAARPAVDALVLGYAETATGLGHSVADALDADYLHSTRRPVPGVVPVGVFQEAHSHATSHLLLPEDPGLLSGPRPLILVDDELSTGATVMDTIRAVQAVAPRDRYLVASLVDLRSPGDRRRLGEFATRHGVRVDVVALATGQLRLPADPASRGRQLATRYGQPSIRPGAHRPQSRVRTAPAGARWPDGVRDGARHGFSATDRVVFEAAVVAVARGLAPEVPTGRRSRLLVLGTEELMYLPMRIAAELTRSVDRDRVEVLFSTTTRSPVVPVDEAGYAIRTALRFGSHDDPADGPGPRYAYNVAAPAGQAPFDAVVVVVDDASRAWPEHADRLLDGLSDVVAGPVTVLTVPSHRPSRPVVPEPLR